jgi:hypothetical protein
MSGRVVQQDQPAGGDLLAVAQHGRAQGEGVRRQAGRRAYLLDLDLRAYRRRPQ